MLPLAHALPSISHGVALHVPLQNGVAPVHFMPHCPHALGSLFGFTHRPSQQRRPSPHAGEHDVDASTSEPDDELDEVLAPLDDPDAPDVELDAPDDDDVLVTPASA